MRQFILVAPLVAANKPFYSDTLASLTGTDCDWNNKTVGVFSDDISCYEEKTLFAEDEMCTLKCPEGKVPTFAELVCKKGEFHPPGFLKKFHWDANDIAQGTQLYCTDPIPIPAPGIKRGMSIWNTGKQHHYYKTYNTIWNNATDFNTTDPTIGWFYTWSQGPNKWAFKQEQGPICWLVTK